MIGRLFRRFWYEGIWLRLIGAAVAVILLQVTPVPQEPRDELRRAVQLSGQGRHIEAAQALAEVYQYQPWSADRLAFRVQEDLLASDPGGAQRDLERLAALRPLTADELVALTSIYIRQGGMIQAENAWRKAVSAGYLDRKAISAKANTLIALQDWPGASAALLGLTLLNPDDAGNTFTLGLVQSLDQPQYAMATITRAIGLDTTLSTDGQRVEDTLALRTVDPPEQVYAQLGVIFVNLGEFELAESALTRATDINPAYAEPLAYLAYTRARLGRPALGALHQALALAPDLPVVHYLAGLTWKEIQRPLDARGEFEAAYDLDQNNPAFPVEIAETFRAERESQYAEIWYQEAVRLAPKDVRVRVLLLQFYADDNYKLQETGLPLAQSLVADYPDSADAHEALGWIYFRLGDTNNALVELTKAVTTDPRGARSNLHLAVVYEAQGDIATAIRYYQRARELDPRGAYGDLALRALQRLGIEGTATP